jgi:FKBP-type peptidyl-prolyl cis-trans isomerase
MIRFGMWGLLVLVAGGCQRIAEPPEAGQKMFRESFKQVQATANKEVGDTFLAEYAKKEGVTKLPSGLCYKVLAAGPADRPVVGPNGSARVRYTTQLPDGTPREKVGYDRTPDVLPVNQARKGVGEAMALMREGDRWELALPSELYYGDRGSKSANIAPGQLVLMTLELVQNANSL